MREPPQHIMEFLHEIGAEQISHHASRSLSEHLTGTWHLLVDWGLDESVCIAGLCHSIYGTESFQTACLEVEERKRVQKILGEEAEELAFLFGALEREAFLDNPSSHEITSRFDGVKIPLSKAQLTGLCDITFANEMDLVFAKKGRDRPDKVIKKVGPVFEKIEAFLSAPAIEFYHKSIV